jgi:uncharacterized protein YbaR (Trm112 family)
MIDPQLLEILVCPENHTALAVADSAILAKLNRAIAGGSVKNRGGQPVAEAVEGGLVRQDGMLLYPIVDDIPVMLIDEAIPLDSLP